MFKQQLHHFGSVLFAGNVKWCEPILHTKDEERLKYLNSLFHLYTPCTENILNINFLSSYQSLGIWIGLFVHKKLCHLVVTTVSSDVQSRQIVVGDIIHGHVMLQQELDAVQVVPLSSHVEG